MQPEIIGKTTTLFEEPIVTSTFRSICTTPEEQHRLLKLFELLMDIDKSIKKRNEENNRNTDNPDKA